MSLRHKTALKAGGLHLATPTGLFFILTVGMADLTLGSTVWSFLFRYQQLPSTTFHLFSSPPTLFYDASWQAYGLVAIVLLIVLSYLFVLALRTFVFEQSIVPTLRFFTADLRQMLTAFGVSVVLVLGFVIPSMFLFIGGALLYQVTAQPPIVALSVVLVPIVWQAFWLASCGCAVFVVFTDTIGIREAFRQSWRLTAGVRLQIIWLGILTLFVGDLLALCAALPIGFIFGGGSAQATVIATGVAIEILLVYPVAVFANAFQQLWMTRHPDNEVHAADATSQDTLSG